MVGLHEVKNEVASMVHFHLVYPEDPSTHRNVRLSGPPGVGKTHVASILAETFRACGMITGANKEPLVKMKSENLLGQSVTETEAKSRDFLNACRGNVILFDEANTFGLQGGGASSFAQCASTEIIRFLDANRPSTIVMVEGPSHARLFSFVRTASTHIHIDSSWSYTCTTHAQVTITTATP